MPLRSHRLAPVRCFRHRSESSIISGLVMPYASIKSGDMYYEMDGTGAPVVYVHGGFASLDTILRDLQPYDWEWEHDLAAQFHFIAYDRRGCCRSSSPDTGYDLVTQTQDLTGLLDHLNIPSQRNFQRSVRSKFFKANSCFCLLHRPTKFVRI